MGLEQIIDNKYYKFRHIPGPGSHKKDALALIEKLAQKNSEPNPVSAFLARIPVSVQVNLPN